MDSILADLETFSPKQDVDPAVAVANAAFCEISNPLTKNDRILSSRLSPTARANQRQYATRSTFADPEAVLHEGDERALLSDLQSFFSMTS
jgi:hypothetical protein